MVKNKFMSCDVVQKTVLIICLGTIIILSVIVYIQITYNIEEINKMSIRIENYLGIDIVQKTSDIQEMNKMSITRDGIVDEIGIDVISKHNEISNEVENVRKSVADIRNSVAATNNTLDAHWRKFADKDNEMSERLKDLESLNN
jgi:hypothetical protein